jgi:hypothetical protein
MLRGYYIHKFAVCKGLLKNNSIFIKTELNPPQKLSPMPRKKAFTRSLAGYPATEK